MMVALDALASWTSFSVMPPTPAVDEAQLHVVALQLAQALGHRLQRALDVGLEHQVEGGRLAPLDLLEEVLQLGPGRRRGDRQVARQPEPLRPGLAQGAGRRQVLGHPQLVAGLRRLGEPEHLHRHRGQRLLDVVAVVVDQGLDLAPRRAGHHRIAHPQGAALDDDRGHRAPADLEVGLEHRAAGPALGAGPQLLHLGHQGDLLEQVVDPGALEGRDLRP